MYTTRLEVGVFVDIEISVPEESRKPSSFFVHRSSKIKPRRPLDQQSSTFKIKPRRPLEELPPIQDQAPTILWINNVDKSTHPTVLQHQSPKALEDPFITVLQDQAQKPLEDLFITVIQDQALTALEETLILKIKPQRLLEDPLKTTFKIKPTALEERSSLD
ncbi:hypothetical protein ACFX19_033192 [Malus domestica]